MEILDAFADLPLSLRTLKAIRPGAHRQAGGLWGGSAALFVAMLQRRTQIPILVLTAHDEDSATLAGDLASFSQERASVLVHRKSDAEGEADRTSEGQRARVLAGLAGEKRFVVLAGIEALLQEAPSVSSLQRGQHSWRRGQSIRQEEVLDLAVAAGMRRVPVVLAPGEVSRRGDVLDLFPLAAQDALRLEFFDDRLESIRTLDPASQMSRQVLEEVAVTFGSPMEQGRGIPMQHLARPDLLVVHYEPLRIEERQRLLADFSRERRQALQRFWDTMRKLTQVEISSLPSHDLDYKILSAGSAVGSGEADPLGRLRSIRGLRGRVMILCRTREEEQRLSEIFAHRDISLDEEQVTLAVGALSRGFRIPDLGITALSNTEFAGVPAASRVHERPVVPSRAIASFFELGPGDLVVHAVHGIARFECIELVEREGSAEDHLRLCFRDEVRLLVLASKIHLVQKYVGAGTASPRLDKLGGKSFARRKADVQDALFDLAADLLGVQAKREALSRAPYPPDDLERDFLDRFPFQDTGDQKVSWAEIGRDLEKDEPMDRLLCGDVGFGKTELAMRASFRVAITGRQVAILVPTTILAEQHAQTFTERFAPLGIRVEFLSRYRPAAERRAILEGLQAGAVDLLVGTHVILGKHVHFKDLGLLIIDEEQRFGVRQKEHFKKLRLGVDVLSLSATPIPRTLHTSLLGIRSISTLSTPPPGRQDVDTRVLFRDPRIMEEALHRELGRGGQVFVLHNRVAGLQAMARLIQKLAPDARVAVGHGQMTGTEMERTVRRFVKGECDVLVSTTIVENGLDLPRANTMLVDRADQFGLAELHQLRGRVGRSEVKAFCYLMMDRDYPPSEEAKRRLKALEEFSQLGAGFAIAMKDLEIRGAGNLLGPQQSGHIAAVGYDMYCQLLRMAVTNAKDRMQRVHEVPEVDVDLRLQAYLPESFLPDPKARLELLREMDGAVDHPSLERIERSLTDRFGKLPVPVRNLLQVFQLKHLLMAQGVSGVQRVEDDRLVVHHPRGQPLGGAWLDRFADVRAVEAGKTHLILPPTPRGPGRRTAQQVLYFLLDVLCGGRSQPKIKEQCTGSERGAGVGRQRPPSEG